MDNEQATLEENSKHQQAWFHAPSVEGLAFSGGPFSSENDAIEAGRDFYDGDFAVFSAEKIDPSEFAGVIDANRIVELIDESISDTISAYDAVEFATDERQANDDLQRFLMEWSKKHLTSFMYEPISSRKVTL
jgi:hypothetical protein